MLIQKLLDQAPDGNGSPIPDPLVYRISPLTDPREGFLGKKPGLFRCDLPKPAQGKKPATAKVTIADQETFGP